MASDVQAIDTLSDRFFEAVMSRKSQGGDRAIVLNRKDPLAEQGLKVLKLYEAELSKNPNSSEVRESLAEHLYRLGALHYVAVTPRALPINVGLGDKFWASRREGKAEFWQDPDSKTLQELGIDAKHNANSACYYYGQSFNYLPSAEAAFQLGEAFSMGQFNKTALYWYDQAERLSSLFDDHEAATNARAEKVALQGEGRTQDPPLGKGKGFPTAQTPGYLSPGSNQPVVAPFGVLVPPFKKSLAIRWQWFIIPGLLALPFLPVLLPFIIVGGLGWFGYKYFVKTKT
jgi:hypothetical protein